MTNAEKHNQKANIQVACDRIEEAERILRDCVPHDLESHRIRTELIQSRRRLERKRDAA